MNNIKKRLLSMLLTVAMLCGLCVPTAFAAENRYSDTKGHWAEKSIDRWSDYGIVQGNNGKFDPNGNMTRAQAATVFAKLLGLEQTADISAFADVSADAWYADALAKCYAAGILKGVAEDKLNPEGTITREMFFVMFARAMGIEEETALEKDFSDANQLSGWAKGSVYALINHGYVNGLTETTIGGGSNINRASVMALLDQTISDYQIKNGKPVITLKSDEKQEENKPENKPSSGGGGSRLSDLIISTTGQEYSSGTYKNVTITADVGNGDVTLNGVTITGDLIVQGGGSNSVKLKGCTVSGKVIMAKESGEAPRLELTNTRINKVEVQKPAIIEATDAASAVAAVEAKASLEVKGENTTVAAITVPAAVEGTVAITGTGSVVAVVAEAPVSVDSATVEKVEVPATATANVAIAVTGDSKVEVAVNSTNGAAITADENVDITLSTDLETAPEIKVNDTPVAHIHKWNVGEVTMEATCKDAGVMTYTCTAEGCSDPVATKAENIPALPHTEVVDKAVAPTCTETGLTEGKHCSVCEKVLVEQEIVPIKKHTWDAGKVTTEPTTTTEGVKTYTCSVCGTTRTEKIPAVIGETKLVVSIAKGPTGDNYVTYINDKYAEDITNDNHFENTVTVSFADLPDVPEGTWLPSYGLRFANCVFEKNLYVEYTDCYLELWFDRCEFRNGAKLIMKGDGNKFNDLMFDVIYDEATYEDGSHCFIRFNPAATENETNYFIVADRGQSIAVTGVQNATFCVGGMVDLSGLTVTPEKRIELDGYASGSGICTINLGNNKAKIVNPGVYFITAASGNTNPVTIASDVDRNKVGLCVNGSWEQRAPTSFLYNIRLEMENGLGLLRWDIIRGNDAFDDAGNPRELRYIVSARSGFYTYEYEAAEGGRLLTFPAGVYDHFKVTPYYLDGKDKVYLSSNSAGVTVKAVEGEVYEDKADATFTLPNTGSEYIPAEDYVVTISGLSGYSAYLMYVDHYSDRYVAFGSAILGTATTAVPVSAVDITDSAYTYTIYGIKDYRLVDGVLSYTIDCLRTTTNVPKAASDVPAP